eukprot:gb/GEZN01001334.1/.p1 GENE.gb/GEZN01001334.1/~~gb/GEZN01001334.1/.p1  ORF type:complete len:1024 (+),score=130.87 gb/GEZN01001334.1/:3-3074(+)
MASRATILLETLLKRTNGDTSTSNELRRTVVRALDYVVGGKSSKHIPPLDRADIVTLLKCRTHDEVALLTAAADAAREMLVGNRVSWVCNRNINFTNACIKKCGFCAFSRTGVEEEAYFLPMEEIVTRAREAVSLGATEVCVQAGLPPNLPPNYYTELAATLKSALPKLHLHAFSPEEVLYGAKRSKRTVSEMLQALQQAGVDTLPGTSAEILVDKVRQRLAGQRLSSKQWIEVITQAHTQGLRTSSTMMYGHCEGPDDIAQHLLILRQIQEETGGFTELVPLSFVASEAPLWKTRQHLCPELRPGPTGIEVLVTHAVCRLAMAHSIDNLQVSWVKEGLRMSQVLLCQGGVNDLGGTLMNESISTAAGSQHGQLVRPSELTQMALEIGRIPYQRTTTYQAVHPLHGEDPSSSTQQTSDGNRTTASSELDRTDSQRFGSFHGLIRETGKWRAKEVLSPKLQGKNQAVHPNHRCYSSSSRQACHDSNSRTRHRQYKRSSGSSSQRTCNSSSSRNSNCRLSPTSCVSASPLLSLSTCRAFCPPASSFFPAFTSSVPSRPLFSSGFSAAASRPFSTVCSVLWSREATLPRRFSPPFSFSAVPSRSAFSSSVHPCSCSSSSPSCFFRSSSLSSRSFSSVRSHHPERVVTYSRSHTLVPTFGCFNVCSYCNFRRDPGSPWLSLEDATRQLLHIKARGGVDEILILSGEVHPKAKERRAWHQRVVDLCRLAIQHGFIPHTNVGPLSRQEMAMLGQVNASMGLMLEQTTPRLLQTVHRFAPSKRPELRVAQLRLAGELGIAFTTGLLLGLGETEQERRQALRVIADIAQEYGHIQEVILQPFSPGNTDRWQAQVRPEERFHAESLPELVATARALLPSQVVIQVPPNLLAADIAASESVSTPYHLLKACLDAGATDLGGISELDEVNPTYAFPRARTLQVLLLAWGYHLQPRLCVHDRLVQSQCDRLAKPPNTEQTPSGGVMTDSAFHTERGDLSESSAASATELRQLSAASTLELRQLLSDRFQKKQWML